QQARRSAAAQIFERLTDVIERQVHEAVAAQHHVGPWKRVGGEIEAQKSSSRAGASEPLLVAGNERSDDVAAGVVQIEGHRAEPPEIAAGQIEQAGGADGFDQARKLLPDTGGCRQLGTEPRAAASSPQVRRENSCKSLFKR